MSSQTASPPGSPPAFQVELQQFDTNYTSAFDAGNAQALAALFAEDAILMNTFGHILLGRSAIAARLEEAFAGPFQGATLQITPHHSTALSEHIVVQQGISRTMRKGDPPDYRDLAYTKVFVRQGTVWKLAAAQFAYPEPNPPMA